MVIIVVIATTNCTILYLQDFVGRDLKDPRLDMMVSAETTTEYSPQLWKAAKEGNLEDIKHLVSMGHNPMKKDSNNNTALHIAAKYGRIEILKYLIEDQGCNPASLGQYGATPLHRAAEGKHLSIVQYLITQHQVDSLEQDDHGYSPLHRACQGGDLAIVKFLINSMLAFMKIEDIFNDFTKYKTTPIHGAALGGHLDIVNYFIVDLKCDPNLHDNDHGRGPIFSASQNALSSP